jgi:tetratricopeptide (TPR) repeat protein
MRVRPLLIAASIATLSVSAAYAITFAPGTRDDPFAPGKQCDAPMLASYGDYVYDWPSKYDLIFAPRDYPQWVWRCEASGYVSFPHEFGVFSNDAEKARIAAYLTQANFSSKLTALKDDLSEELYQHLEKIYALRDPDEAMHAYLMRYFAWQHKNKPAADAYRQKAIDIYKKLLAANTLKDADLLEAIYILGFYSWKLGHKDEAKTYFEQLKNTVTIDPKTRQQKRGAPFLENLANDVMAGKADDKVRFANEPK